MHHIGVCTMESWKRNWLRFWTISHAKNAHEWRFGWKQRSNLNFKRKTAATNNKKTHTWTRPRIFKKIDSFLRVPHQHNRHGTRNIRLFAIPQAAKIDDGLRRMINTRMPLKRFKPTVFHAINTYFSLIYLIILIFKTRLYSSYYLLWSLLMTFNKFRLVGINFENLKLFPNFLWKCRYL